MNQLALFLCVK